jgi:hypothetical protein
VANDRHPSLAPKNAGDWAVTDFENVRLRPPIDVTGLTAFANHEDLPEAQPRSCAPSAPSNRRRPLAELSGLRFFPITCHHSRKF